MEEIKSYENAAWKIAHNRGYPEKRWFLTKKKVPKNEVRRYLFIDEAEIDDLIALLSKVRNV